jgi:hypothetical protein
LQEREEWNRLAEIPFEGVGKEWKRQKTKMLQEERQESRNERGRKARRSRYSQIILS